MTLTFASHGEMPEHINPSALEAQLNRQDLKCTVHLFGEPRTHLWEMGTPEQPFVFINCRPERNSDTTTVRDTDFLIYRNNWDLYVPIDPEHVKLTTPQNIYVFAKAIANAVKDMTEQQDNQFRLEHNPELLAALDRSMETTTKNELDDAKSRLNARKEKASDLREAIMHNLRNIEKAEQKVIALEDELENGSNASEKMGKDWKALLNDDKITDILFKSGWFHIHTDKMPIHASPSQSVYEGGPYEIKINFNDGAIRVFAPEESRHRGYWSSADPHPHIGNGVNPCFGNLDETVAVLLSQFELSALVYSLIDFLQSANQNDPAGRNVQHWPLLKAGDDHDNWLDDEDGDDHDDWLDDEDMDECERCGDMEREDEFVEVYDRVDYETDSLHEFREVCRDCADDLYQHSPWFDALVSNDTYNDEYEESVR